MIVLKKLSKVKLPKTQYSGNVTHWFLNNCIFSITSNQIVAHFDTAREDFTLYVHHHRHYYYYVSIVWWSDQSDQSDHFICWCPLRHEISGRFSCMFLVSIPLSRMTRGARHSLGGYKLWRVMRWGLINYLPEPPSITINWPLLLSPAARPAQP